MANDYEKFKTNAIAYVVEFAQFAEKHKVYRIVPFGEIDNHMFNHCDKITELAEELLTEMRKTLQWTDWSRCCCFMERLWFYI